MRRLIVGMASFIKAAKSDGLDTSGLSYEWAGARIRTFLYAYELADDPIEDHLEKDEVDLTC